MQKKSFDVIIIWKCGEFMTYLDYSATTFVDDDVLTVFSDNFDVLETESVIEEEKNKIKNLLHTDLDVLYTSGATESNNWALKGIALKYSGLGYHIITTRLEHSSINETLRYLEKRGFIIDYVDLIDGVVDISSLKRLITDKTILVSIVSVNSELGVLQPISEIGLLLREYPQITFHSDMTQSMGKVAVSLEHVDLVSFTAHKFFGLKGIGCLLKKSSLVLKPLFYGDRKYNVALIKSMGVALEKALDHLEDKYSFVSSLNEKIVKELGKYPDVFVNSNCHSIPHILNISVLGFKPETLLHTLEIDGVYISTKSACSSSLSKSDAVYAVTGDERLASTSIRISLSYKTTNDDISKLLFSLKKALIGVDNYE